MENYICETCGTQYPASEQEPDECPICLDDRIYGAWWNRVVADGAKAAVARSAERYIRALESA